jgi:oligopeptide transport system ATP-binding protein
MQTDSSQTDAILAVHDLVKRFPIRSGMLQRITGWVRAVNGVDFQIPEGRTLGLVGESGCGKSTVARMLLKLLDPDGGRIVFRGRDIAGMSKREMKPFRKQIQIVFQDPFGSLNPRLTVGQSIEEGLRILGLPHGPKRRGRLEELLVMVGMSADSADRYPHEFSGGQRQRIGIARALSVEPSLVICDEPISALDVSIQAQIINLLKDLQQVAVMYRGVIMEQAPAEALFENPRHPYTRSLLSAILEPDPTHRQQLLLEDGDAPPLPTLPAGCAFRDRCPLGEDTCDQAHLEFVTVAPNHRVRCWKTAADGSVRFTP